MTTPLRLPAKLLASIKRIAAKHRRSANEEMVVALEDYVAASEHEASDERRRK